MIIYLLLEVSNLTVHLTTTKSLILQQINRYPKLVTLGISFAITFVVETTIQSMNGIDFHNADAQPENGYSVDQ
jgi:hypothetical protein